MKAAIYTGLQKIDIKEVDYIKPAPGYLVLDTQCTGICGSDLHFYNGHLSPPQTTATGHETCGIVREVGAGVTEFQAGDKVTVEVWSHCGRCLYCKKGLYNHCTERKASWDGGQDGFAEYTTAHASSVFKLPESMSFEQGALVEPVAVCYRALVQAGATFQDRVAIIGGGAIGLYCLAVAKAIGVKETLITVKYDQQARLAQAFGADHIVEIGETDVTTYVADITAGFGLDVVIDTVGSAQAIKEALAITRKRGTIVLVAVYPQPLEVDLHQIMISETVVTGSFCYGYSGMTTDFEAAIDLIASGKIEAAKLVTHRFPLQDIGQAFKTAADKTSGAVKVHVYQ